MNSNPIQENALIRDLGDGLVLRRSGPADAEALSAFSAAVHAEDGEEDEHVRAWTRDLLTRPHPTFAPDDFTVVEDRTTGKIVSTLNLISQTWTYAGIPFGVGRPELVGTHPDYRRRGLVRTQMEEIHRWSAARGHAVQAITGIPWFYRQFGYEMALNLGGGRQGYRSMIPDLQEGEDEPMSVRPATRDDLPFLADTYQQAQSRYLISCLRDEAVWRLELDGRSEQSANRRELHVIARPSGERVGYLAVIPELWKAALGVTQFEVRPGKSWLAVAPTVLRFLERRGEQLAREDDEQSFDGYIFWLGDDHPAYDPLRDWLPKDWPPYAWYLRVPDLGGFLRRLTPALNRRLADSPQAGHTGDLTLSFYRAGLRLRFDAGDLTVVEAWRPESAEEGDVRYPGHTFLQALFGYRRLEELEYAFADCRAKNAQVRSLLDTLFPRQASAVWPVS